MEETECVKGFRMLTLTWLKLWFDQQECRNKYEQVDTGPITKNLATEMLWAWW